MTATLSEKKPDGLVWELEGPPLTIGRTSDNTIVMPVAGVADRQAVVAKIDGRYVVDDRSGSGVLVNGARRGRAVLKNGDEIEVGGRVLVFGGAPEVEAAAPASTPEVAMLDELVDSIRSHRDREQIEKELARIRLREEWDKVLHVAERLQQRVKDDARVKYFAVDRREADVLIRLQRTPSSTSHMIHVSLRHPEHRDHAMPGFWLRRSGEQDRCLDSAQALSAELVRELAYLLA